MPPAELSGRGHKNIVWTKKICLWFKHVSQAVCFQDICKNDQAANIKRHDQAANIKRHKYDFYMIVIYMHFTHKLRYIEIGPSRITNATDQEEEP